MTVPEIPPAFLLILGALLVPFLRGTLRSAYVIALPAAALAWVFALPEGASFSAELIGGLGKMEMLRVDKLSRIFGVIFALNAAVAFLFAWYVRTATQHVAALIYIGGALGVAFAGDLFTLYIFWEIMAVASAIVILSRNTEQARGAAFRYVMIHLVGGVILLGGIILQVSGSGSIAFDGFDFGKANLGTWMILVGVLINAAAPPLSAWLSDAYPEASVTGGVILSAYTTKTSVYVLLRGFAGWDYAGGAEIASWSPLVWVGCAMSVYGIIFALLENDMRRILAYSIINQVGFMVCAAGIGGHAAISGASAHAFCHIIYKSLLWMSAGAVLYRVGKSRCTELGGLYKTMPWTLIFGTIGALAISAVPLTSGFTSKTIIIFAAEQKHLTWPWLILEIASAGVFLHAGIKFPYFVFFNQDRGLRPKEAPKSMLAAMAVLAFLCLALGVYPQPLYDLLPFGKPADFHAYTAAHLVTQMQLLMLSALVFFLFLKLLKRTPTIVLDTDWFYRRGGAMFYAAMDRMMNSANDAARRGVVGKAIPALTRSLTSAPGRLAVAFMTPIWKVGGADGNAMQAKRENLLRQAKMGAFPIGITACLAVLLLAVLFGF